MPRPAQPVHSRPGGSAAPPNAERSCRRYPPHKAASRRQRITSPIHVLLHESGTAVLQLVPAGGSGSSPPLAEGSGLHVPLAEGSGPSRPAGGRQRPSRPAGGRQRPFTSCREAALALPPETKHPTIPPKIHGFRIALRVDHRATRLGRGHAKRIVPLRALPRMRFRAGGRSSRAAMFPSEAAPVSRETARWARPAGPVSSSRQKSTWRRSHDARKERCRPKRRPLASPAQPCPHQCYAVSPPQPARLGDQTARSLRT
jgi:hypothetical protein